MYCKKCGYEINQEDVFCPKCGAPSADAPKKTFPAGELIRSNPDSELATRLRAMIIFPFIMSCLSIFAFFFASTFIEGENRYSNIPDIFTNLSYVERIGAGIGCVITGIILLIINLPFALKIYKKLIKAMKPVFENTKLCISNGKLIICGSSVAEIYNLQSFEIDCNDIVKVQCNKEYLNLNISKKPASMPVDEIVVFTTQNTYRVWGLKNSPELVNNINQILGL